MVTEFHRVSRFSGCKAKDFSKFIVIRDTLTAVITEDTSTRSSVQTAED